MEDFKLIAIRPLNGCDKKYRKVLRPNKVYKFYNNFDFNHEGDIETNEVISIKEKESISPFFFSFDNFQGTLKTVNISAIVGKNGSGKSTLIELLFASVYLYSIQNRILNKNPINATTII